MNQPPGPQDSFGNFDSNTRACVCVRSNSKCTGKRAFRASRTLRGAHSPVAGHTNSQLPHLRLGTGTGLHLVVVV